MGEATKQARLDNWAMFVMSRLQVFFNTTDYCDLTLQFEGNVQLKVHRVIMNACTEYFRLLEQECECMDGDILIMPPDLQADVILPIVNFMYTGILEYHQSIYDRLYHTAELMNMTVLLKFLDAQKVKMKTPRMHAGQMRKMKTDRPQPSPPARKLAMWKRKTTPLPQINPVKPYSPETRNSFGDGSRFDNAPKPTRFEWPDDEMQDIKPFDLLPLDSAFDSISYSSKPLLTQEDEMRSTSNSSVFDDLRQLPGGKVTKRTSEPAKEKDYLNTSLDMEDLKSYVKEQKIRSDLADFDDDEDPDDPDYNPGDDHETPKRKLPSLPIAAKKAKISHEKENIVEVRATSTKVDHSKIISEVMKKYPHLMQKNKNVRLKIIAKNKHEDKEKLVVEKEKPKVKTMTMTSPQLSKKDTPLAPLTEADYESTKQKKTRSGEHVWICPSCPTTGEPVEFVLYYLYRKHMTDAHHKQFDIRECKHCGEMYELPLQMTYHMQMAHAVMPPRSIAFPKCAQCSYIAYDKDVMGKHEAFHAAHPKHVQCVNCKLGFATPQNLKAHMQLAGHNGKNNLSYDCQYCTRQLNSASSLFVHCKTTHADDAQRDGMLSVDESHLIGYEPIPEKPIDEKSEEGVDSSLESFDLVVLEDQQQYILDEQDAPAQEDFISLPAALQEQQYTMGQGDIGSTDELVMVLTDHDYNDGNEESMISNDNSNIVVLYSHPVDGQQNQFITSQGNLRLNSETGMLELHNDDVPMSSQAESIELIQKEIQSHVVNSMAQATTEPTQTQTIDATPAETVLEAVEQVAEDVQENKETPEQVELEPEKILDQELKQVDNVEQSTIEHTTDTTDFGMDLKVEQLSQPEPEPMEIDEELKNLQNTEVENIESTLQEPAKENIEPSEVPSSDTTEQSSNTRTPESEVVTPLAIPEKNEEVPESADITSDAITLQQQPDTDVPQELLEPSMVECTESIDKDLVPDEEISLPTPLVTQSELINQTAQNNEEEYKTSASLSVSEQFPEEPMEVDGALIPQEESKSEETEKLPETTENTEKVADIVQSTNDETTNLIPEKPDVLDKELSEETPKDVVDVKKEDVSESDTATLDTATLDTATLPVLEEPAVPSEQNELLATPELATSTDVPQPEVLPVTPEVPIEQPAETVQETAEKSDIVMEDKAASSTIDETSSLPESIEEPPSTDAAVFEPEEPDTHVDDLLVDSTTNDVELEKARKQQEKEKSVGITTLLNDWEDTDSQTSDTGKAAAVNKLINDWDDE